MGCCLCGWVSSPSPSPPISPCSPSGSNISDSEPRIHSFNARDSFNTRWMQEPYKNVRRKKIKERERKLFVYLYLRDCQTPATCYWWLKDRCSRMGHRPRLHLCSVAPHCCYFPKDMRECDAIHHLRSRMNRARFPALLPPTFNE